MPVFTLYEPHRLPFCDRLVVPHHVHLLTRAWSAVDGQSQFNFGVGIHDVHLYN